MLYLFWTVLNISLVIYFIVICFRATKLVREKLGFLASIIFVFGLLSFVSNPSNNNNNSDGRNNQIRNSSFVSEAEIIPNSSNLSIITIDSTWISTINLLISYGKQKISNKTVGTQAYSSLLGVLGGHVWKPLFISLEETAQEGKLKYYLIGSLEWKALGATVYSQRKSYSGVIDSK